MDTIRARILELVAARRPATDLRTASKACGPNHAYLYQFIHRGTPKRLPEEIRRRLCHHLGIDESLLRNIEDDLPMQTESGNRPKNIVREPYDEFDPQGVSAITQLQIAASAGGGAAVENEALADPWYLPDTWVSAELNASASNLRMILIDGDSMEPTLRSGDQVIVNVARRSPSPPGIFVVFDGLGLVAKQIEVIANSEPPKVHLVSTNRRYPTYERTLDEINIIGRVVWYGRRL